MKKTVGKRKVSTRKLGASVMALAVAVIMVFTMIPAEAFAKTVDLDTTTRYTESLGDDASTEYAGRVWTDKTVYEGDAAFDLYGGGKATVENDSDFLVAYSALATAQSIEGYSTVPLDVVFVIDMSGSMSKNTMDNRKTRMQNAAEALNDSMEELLELNEHVRVGVVGFNLDSTILLPLDHYEKISGQDFITAVDGDTIRIRAKGSSDTYNFEESTESGTNMQRGFWEGMNMLATVDSTIAVINGKNVERTPSIILLSDGEPSKASRNTTTTWWDLKGDNNRDGQTNPKSIYGMKALMTATYMKKAIDRKYGTPEVTVYSVGVGIADLDDNNRELAYATINPAAYLATDSTSMVRDLRNTWNNYANNRTATLDGYTFQHPSSYDIVETGAYSDLYYVDSYFDISNKEMMDTVFKSIIEEIIYEKAQVPTEIKTNDPLTDGYITYIDPVGEYMEVKELKSILYAGQEFELPSGYTPTTESDGSLVYKFTGEVHSAVYGDQNLANIIIKVSPDRDQITIQIPAALIPIRVNSVVLDANGHVLTHTNNGAYPIRVLYTVGVKDSVLSADGSVTSAVAQTYIDQNSNDDGTVNFYSNKYSGKTYTLPNGETVTIGDATVEFSPSKENQFYYAQEDMAIYTDEECTTPAKGSLDDNKTYYYKDEFYHETHEDHTAVARTGKQLKAQTLNTNAAGELFIKAGAPLINRMMEFEGKKKNNATETASEFYVPTFNEEHNDIVVYLGNNGVLTAKASGTLEFSKEVNAAAGLTAPDKEFTFTVDFAGADGEYQYIITDALGNIIGDDDSDGYTGKIKDNGTIKLKDGQNAKIINLPAGAKYTVTETAVSGFTTTVNGVEQSNATGTVVAGEGSVFEFVNTYSAQPVSVNVNTTFDGAKVLTGRDWTDEDSFTFKLESRRADTPMPEGSTLVAGSHMVKEVTVTAPVGTAAGTAVDYVFGADGETIQYTKPGVYEYVISEKMPDVDLPGVSYSGAMYVVTVTVTDNGDGTLAALAVMSKVLDDSGKDFAAIDNEVEKATFTNAFDTEHVTWVPVGSKYYVDNSGSKPIETGMFEFEMKGLDGAPMPERAGGSDTFVVTNVDTEVAYDAVEFKKEHAGASEALAKEYTYEFREVIPSTPLNGMTYETTTFKVTVKVYLKDGSIVVDPEYPSGTRLEFTNIYTPEKTTAVINGTKAIEGREWLSSDSFVFKLEAVTAGAPMPAASTATVDSHIAANADGVKSFAFGNIEYTKAGVYEYKVYETGTDRNGLVLDKHVCNVKVTVKDENGKLAAKVVYDGGAGHDTAEFVNKYTPVFDDSTAVNVIGSKELSGKAILAGEFYFRVEPQEGAPMGGSYSTNTVKADGTFDILKNVKYDKAGTYYYKVTESIPSDAVNGVHQGITYDDNEFIIKVVVRDDNAGKLTASWSILDGDKTVNAVVFKNKYETEDAYLKLPTVEKVVTGRDFDPAAEKYNFQLSVVTASPADGIKLPANTIVQNNDAGRIAFDEITFTKPGTYVVQIGEVVPASSAKGMSYDSHKITITIDVVDTGAGTLKVTYREVSGKAGFENVYKAAPVDVTLQGSKTLEGRALTADDKFNFAITATTADAPMPAVTNVTNSGEKVSFGPVTYDKTGVYEYEIRETGTGADGITFDNGTVKAVVTVTDVGSDGQLDAKVDYVKSGEGAGFQFINKYDAKSASVEFKGTKTLEGVKLLEGKFSFVLRPAGSNPAADPLKGESVVTNSADGAFNFGSLTFTEPGVYVYGIGEEAGSYHGMSYDATLYTVTVTVTDNGKGQLTAKTDVLKTNPDESHADVTINDIKFHNVYDADTAEVVIHGHKHLEGAELTDGQFHFEIKAKTAGAPMPAVTNVASTAAGQFHFPNIVFNAKDFGTEAKVFEYEITEVKGSAAGYTYDSHVETVKVTVQKDDKGVMHADVEYANDHAVEFYNKYEAAPATAAVKAIKALSGRDLKAGEFEFELKGEAGAPMPANATAANDELGNIAFGEITFSKVGTYKYTVAEKDNAIGGITYDSSVYGVIIDVTDVGHDGQLDAKVTYINNGKTVSDIKFTNKYTTKAAEYDLPIYKKVVTGRDFDPAAEKFEFKLSLVSADPADGVTMPAETVVKNDNAGNIDFDSMVFTKAGTYIVVVQEVVTAEAGGMTYDTYPLVVNITVTDNGKGQLVATAEPASTKDTFENKYEAKAAVAALEGEKVLNGRAITDADNFAFIITAKTDGAPMPAVTTVTNEGDTISFGAISYDKTGVYEYEITEKGKDENGITYDKGTVKAIVTVTDEGYDGQLDAKVEYVKEGEGHGFQFINEYNADSVEVGFRGTKKLTGVALLEGKFSFVLRPAESNPAADPVAAETVVANAADGTIDFGKFTYTKPGVYVYGIGEEAGDYHGMHYDATLYTVTVTVEDDGLGQLTAKTEVLKTNPDESHENVAMGDIQFNNVYDPHTAEVVIHGHKHLEGASMTDGQFRFEIKAKSAGAPMPAVTTVANTAAGQFHFPAIEFEATDFGTEAKVFEYEITEVQGTAPGYTYDSSVQTVKVTVQKDSSGILYATTEYAAGHAVEFTNRYEPAPATAVVKAAKELDGRNLKANEFEFELKAKDGAPLPGDTVAVNDAAGNVVFDEIEFAKPGTYKYNLVEKDTNISGIVYDKTVYGVTIVVTDNHDGQLTAEVTYTNKGKAVETAVFQNGYFTKEAKVTLETEKKLSGRTLKASEFVFELKGEDGAPMPAESTAGNDAAGKVKFGAITFDKAGTYKYTISERNNGVPGVEYDDGTVAIAVEVVDDGHGNLISTWKYDSAKTSFENKYVTKHVDVTFGGTKELTGADLYSGVFSFVLKPAESNPAGDPVDKEYTVTNSADGSIGFGEFTYTKPGVYVYGIGEAAGDYHGMHYDATLYTVTVTVADDGKGQLTAKTEVLKTNPDETHENVTASGIKFHNVYDPHTAAVVIHGHKHLEGGTLEDGQFSFEIAAKTDGAPMPAVTTVANTAAGQFHFPEITFSAADYGTEAVTYEYTVKEVVGSAEGYTYDTSEELVIVKVQKDENGVLFVETDYEQGHAVEFYNKYDDPTPPTEPTDPSEPSDPTDPSEPEDPTDPSDPADPSDPTEPGEPSDPADPSDPTEPGDPMDEPSDGGTQTGDDFNAGLYGFIALAALAVAGAAVRRRKVE